MTESPTPTQCSAARTGSGYWTCDVLGGCRDCRLLARAIGDTQTLAGWKAEVLCLYPPPHKVAR